MPQQDYMGSSRSTRRLPRPSIIAVFILFAVASSVIQMLLHLHHLSTKGHMDHEVIDVLLKMTESSQSPSTSSVSRPKLPQWIQDYVKWHKEMRAKFPGSKIFTDPDSPGVILRWCGGLCGGLHDRLGQLPLDLYLANQTRRVLFLKWEKPHALELFLVPPLSSELYLDWRFPEGVPNWAYVKPGDINMIKTKKNIDYVQNLPGIGNSGTENFDQMMEQFLIKCAPGGELHNEPLVVLRMLGHLNEKYLESKLIELGESDTIHSTPTFGNIWHMFFQPSPPILAKLDQIMNEELHLQKRNYTAVHCRVRHPKAYKSGTHVHGRYDGTTADKTGLPFGAGPVRDMAVQTAIHALKCASTQIPPRNGKGITSPLVNKDEIYYFMSDSNDLVELMVRDIKNAKFISKHPSMDIGQDSGSIYQEAHKISLALNIRSRDNSQFNSHIDKNKGKELEEYYGTFIDLYLAMYSRCIAFGIGFYAVFAAKIGGITDCKIQYAKEEWGLYETAAKPSINICKSEMYAGLF